MKTAICAMAKGENAYIGDWISHHLTIGYDEIYLYDNNPTNEPNVADSIHQAERSRVHIIQISDIDFRRGFVPKQCQLYDGWIAQYGKLWDWCSFIDIDEYVVTPDIKALLASMPDKCDFMLLNWLMYGDSGQLDGDERVPVRERLIQPAEKTGQQNRVVKQTIRCNREGVKCATPHSFWYGRGNRNAVYYNCYGQPTATTPLGSVTNNCGIHTNHYIAHYATKTMGEFLRHKAPRLEQGYLSEMAMSRYFFRINEHTPEKAAMLHNYCVQNRIKLS